MAGACPLGVWLGVRSVGGNAQQSDTYAVVSRGDVLRVDNHSFEFRGVTYNSDGTSTWSYNVTSGRKPALSHWVLGFDPSLLRASNVISCSERYEVNTDPTTGVYGLKFDGGYKDDETRSVTFTLDGRYSVVSTSIGVKAGKEATGGAPLSGPGPMLADKNSPPIAEDDRASTNENESMKVDVLANDADKDGTLNRSTVTITRAPASGSVSRGSDDGHGNVHPDAWSKR